MRFAIDLIGSSKTESERESRLESLDAATEELNALVDELLNYVRLETADHPTHLELLAVDEMVAAVVERHGEMYPHLDFVVDVSRDTWLNADQAGVHRVLANLVGNACRFAKQTIRIKSMNANDTVSLLVDDDGPGIPPEDRERVFNPFVRLSMNGDSVKGSGVGLGLALVSRIVQQHGGVVSIKESDLGGCRIKTEWPLRPANSGAARHAE